ncbi:hypothetical protein G6F60_014510 [Rhizopus arrhizus]|nr:hypothetical protein G6F24_018658 [Rhizopus arrhizus]KAG1386342.1 hypothetical protein G6F60_014510 [Rhizopus arrhizus]
MRVEHLGELVRHAAGGDLVRFHPVEGHAVLGAAGAAGHAGMLHGQAASGGSRNQERGCGFSTKWAAAQEIP